MKPLMSLDIIVHQNIMQLELNATRAYKSQLPISVAKYNDLRTLCPKGIIPKELHSWYAELPTFTSAVDTTAELAIGDSGDEN